MSHSIDNISNSIDNISMLIVFHLLCTARYDRGANELVCDAIGVAYPIIDGVPNLVPQDARMLKNTTTETSEESS